MRFPGLILVPLALAAASSAAAQQAPYVDPALRNLLRPAAQLAIRNAAVIGPQVQPDNQPLATNVAIRKSSPLDVARVALFAQVRSEAALSELERAGARIGSRIGDIVTAEVPIDRLGSLLSSASFEMFEASHDVAITNDSSMHATRADVVRRAAGGSWTGTAGRGVIVGVYDTGLDFTHGEFLDEAGQTRVLELWDQVDIAGPPPAGFSYGRYCSRAAIQQVISNPANKTSCPQQDVAGHGTHVAGTAAGDGSAIGLGGTPYVFAGVAPLADLMIVKGGDALFSESGVIDGLAWLEREARALNRPMVVNLSIGGQAGPHDGTRLYELAVDNLSRPGFVVVFAGGNEGFNANDRNPDGSEPTRDPTYFHGSGPPGAARDFTIQVSPYTAQSGACNDYVNFSLWYEANDVIDISVLRPDGGLVTAAAGQVREADSQAGHVRIDNGSGGTNARNNAFEADIRIDDCGSTATPPLTGVWTLRVSPVTSGSGKPYHFWLSSQSLGGGSFARGRQGFDNHYIVSSPGNARSAITVGAFVTKLCWTSPAKPEGPVCFVTRESIGDVARFSSAGPTRDGRLKPEITAPGLAIVSARSANAAVGANRVTGDGVHWANQGTSMAAPHVAGAIALLLEGHPTLTSEQVKDIFRITAEHDQFTSRVYDTSLDADARYWWGFGKLNVCAALGASGTSGGGSGPVVITPVADTVPVNATANFFSCSPTGASISFHSTNPAVATIDASGTVRTLQLGTTLVVATSGTFADTARLVVVDPANLHISLRSIAPTDRKLSPSGTRLPLLAATLRVNGYEGMRVSQLSLRLTGRDPAARVLIIADVNRNGAVDSGERTVAGKTVALAGTPVQLDLPLDSVVISKRDSVNLIAAVELSGGSPNGSSFVAELVPSGTHTQGLRSSATNRVEAITTPLASGQATTTVLAAEQTFSLSENPVRSGRLVFNYDEAPRSAAIYTLTGRLVANLKQREVVPGSIEWDLTNDDGAHIASGAYLTVFQFSQRTVREKIFVLGQGQP